MEYSEATAANSIPGPLITANLSSPLSHSPSPSSSPPPPPPSQAHQAVISPCATCKILRRSNIIKFLQATLEVLDRLTDARDEDQEQLAILEEGNLRLTGARDEDQELPAALEGGNLTRCDAQYIKLLRSTVRTSNAHDAGKDVLIAAAFLHVWLATTETLSGADTALIMSSLFSFAVGYLVSPPPARGGRRGNQGVVSIGLGSLRLSAYPCPITSSCGSCRLLAVCIWLPA